MSTIFAKIISLMNLHPLKHLNVAGFFCKQNFAPILWSKTNRQGDTEFFKTRHATLSFYTDMQHCFQKDSDMHGTGSFLKFDIKHELKDRQWWFGVMRGSCRASFLLK